MYIAELFNCEVDPRMVDSEKMILPMENFQEAAEVTAAPHLVVCNNKAADESESVTSRYRPYPGGATVSQWLLTMRANHLDTAAAATTTPRSPLLNTTNIRKTGGGSLLLRSDN